MTKTRIATRGLCRGGLHRLLFAATVGILFVGATTLRFRHPGSEYQAAFFDDFYYYLVIARHFVRDRMLSFDGIVWTNGYQPLWLAAIIGLLEITGDANVSFFVILSLLIATLALGFLFFMVRIGSVISGGDPLSITFAFYGAFFLLTLSKSGMEISATCCLMAAFLWRLIHLPISEQTFLQSIGTGFIASIMVLTRLDAALLIICLATVLILSERRQWRRLLISATGFGVGGFLVPIYLLFNRISFDTWTPVSGQAKQLRTDFTPALTPLRSLFESQPVNLVFVYPGIAVTGIGLVLLVLGRPSRLTRPVRQVAAAALLMVPLYYVTYAMITDWQLWPWYLYPFAPALGIGGALIVAVIVPELRGRWIRPAAIVSVIALAYLYVGVRELYRPPERNYIYMAALDISRFARSHPGTYAMGDRAGTVGYLLNNRLVQTEGLVMDEGFLDHIRRRRDLIEVLREYRVRYHVATNPIQRNGCYHVEEPEMAGADSPRMTGDFCSEPIMRRYYPGATTMIFEVPQK